MLTEVIWAGRARSLGYVRFFLSKLKLTSYFSSVCIYHFAINVGATHLGLVRLRARLSSCAEILCKWLPRLRVQMAATFACPMGLARQLPARNSTGPLRQILAIFLPFRLPYSVSVWLSFFDHISNFWELSRERKKHPSVCCFFLVAFSADVLINGCRSLISSQSWVWWVSGTLTFFAFGVLPYFCILVSSFAVLFLQEFYVYAY